MTSKVFKILLFIILGLPAMLTGILLGIIYESFMAGTLWASSIIDELAETKKEEIRK